jgi:hypothetical protein
MKTRSNSFIGKEADDNRLMTEADDATLSVTVNSPGTYRTVCVEIELVSLLSFIK